jgi:hypothetical protein
MVRGLYWSKGSILYGAHNLSINVQIIENVLIHFRLTLLGSESDCPLLSPFQLAAVAPEKAKVRFL